MNRKLALSQISQILKPVTFYELKSYKPNESAITEKNLGWDNYTVDLCLRILDN